MMGEQPLHGALQLRGLHHGGCGKPQGPWGCRSRSPSPSWVMLLPAELRDAPVAVAIRNYPPWRTTSSTKQWRSCATSMLLRGSAATTSPASPARFGKNMLRQCWCCWHACRTFPVLHVISFMLLWYFWFVVAWVAQRPSGQ